MIGLDTNVVVRYIMQDEPKQTQEAIQFIESYLSDQERGYLTIVVVVEIIWVLKTVYRVSKPELVTLIRQLLTTTQLQIERADLVYQALRIFESSCADFSDSLIATVAKSDGCRQTVTFDKAAISVGMQLLPINKSM